MSCSFSAYIGFYNGPAEPLEAHLKRCEECRFVASLIPVMEESLASRPNIRTPHCPDDATMAAYNAGTVDRQTDEKVYNHIHEDGDGCAFCLFRIRKLVEQTDPRPSAEEMTRRLQEADKALSS